ncbi:Morn repeat domain containing protein [Pandoravirus salinus]|uniref:Morn repeat domain containing protein n=1 Tax=Pandoravirus salinus TaxID=1349410 RepID=S4VXT3_9VIRU|nr:morn repeat domain [Pandoravirus salinus]AGO85178.1 Morn repeat domain containing protein [Pandoravirus salinus]
MASDDAFARLPDEIVLIVLVATGDARAVLVHGATSRRYHDLASDASVWRQLYTDRFGTPLRQRFSTAGGKDWRWLYRARACASGTVAAVVAAQGPYWGDLVDGLPDGYGLGLVPSGYSAKHRTGEAARITSIDISAADITCKPRYEGQWRRGKPHGMGVWTYNADETREGLWEDGKRQGYGVATRNREARVMHTQWTGDVPQGHTILEWSDGERHQCHYNAGENKQSDLHDYVVHTCPLGSFYRGGWRDGRPHGYGVLRGESGNCSEGEWRDGRIDGYIVRTHPDGFCYRGGWDRFRGSYGFGTCAYPDGSRIAGTWIGSACTQGTIDTHRTVGLPCTDTDPCGACAALARGLSLPPKPNTAVI